MRTYIFTIIVFLSIPFFAFAQGVGINTSDIDDGSALQVESNTGAFIPPRMTQAERDAIPSVLDGAMIFNTDSGFLEVRENGVWTVADNISPTNVLLNRSRNEDGSFNFATGSTYHDLPVDATRIDYIDSEFYQYVSPGEIRILVDGYYLVDAGISSNNMPASSITFALRALVNGSEIGVLKQGHVNLPSSNYWGTSGSLVFSASVGDLLNVEYLLDHTSNISGFFARMSVSRISR